MPELSVQQITDIISYIEGSESFLNTSVKERFGELTAFDFATGLLPVGKIAESEEDLFLTQQRLTDLSKAKSILKSARDSTSSSSGECAAIVAALNNLAGSLNLTNQFNTLLAQINVSLSNMQTAILNAIASVQTTVNSIQTTVNTINTRTTTMNTNINTINTNVSDILTTVNSIQTTVGNINVRTIGINTNVNSINTNVNTILAWNNSTGVLQLIKTCCDNLTTSFNSFNTTTINNKLDTIISWNATGGVLLNLANNVNNIIGWVNANGILTLIQNKVNADFDLSVQIKACCDSLSTNSGGNNPDITTIKECCAALTTSVSNNLSLSNTINTTIQSWVGTVGILTIIDATTKQALECCEDVYNKLDVLDVNIDLSPITSQLTTIQNNQNNHTTTLNQISNYVDSVELTLTNISNTTNNTYQTVNEIDDSVTNLSTDITTIKNTEFPNISGNIQVADCDVETFTPLPYSGKGLLGVSSQLTQMSIQMNMLTEELCNRVTGGSNPINITGNIPTIVCNEDYTITETNTPFTNLTSALTIIGTQITNTRKDLCKADTKDCATLYPIDMFAEFNYETQMTIWFEDESKSRWDFKVPNPKDFVASDWCEKIHPITIQKGSVYGRIFYANSKVPSSGYFSTAEEATRVLNLLGNLSNETFSQPRITINPNPKRIPKNVLIKPVSVIISTISNNQIVDTKCYKAPIGGCV